MPNYNTQTVVFPDNIPSDLLMKEHREIIKAFGGTIEEHAGKAYIFFEDGPLSVAEIESCGTVVEVIDDVLWEMFQDIIRRSNGTIPNIIVQQAYTASKMISDGFGGGVIVITKDAIVGTNTQEWAREKLKELEKEKGTMPLWVSGILNWMHQDRDFTVQYAKDRGYEGPKNNARKIISFLADTSMDPEDYARIHKAGARLVMGNWLIQKNDAPEEMKAEAQLLALFAYDVVDG